MAMKKILSGLTVLVFVFSAAGANPPREVPSVMTLKQMQAYLEGEPVDEALPAQAFGYPHPRQVLDLEKELELTAEQKKRMQYILTTTHSDAVALGKKIVGEELLLDDLFRKGKADLPAFYAELGNRLESIGGWRWRLREAHLSAYVKTKMALNSDQLRKYHELQAAAPEEVSKK